MAGSNPREQRAQALFKTGLDAAQKNNFDYAIQMFQDACKLVPDNLDYRKHLRLIERRKFGNDPNKVGRLVGVRLQGTRLSLRSAKGKSEWARVLELCEEAFAISPWDIAASQDAAEAAEHLGLKQLAEWLLESVSALATDAGFFRHLAHVHGLNENWQKAIVAWEHLKKLDPNDEEAGRQINALSANATIARSGLSEAIHRSAEGSSGPEAPEAEDVKQPMMTPEQRLLKQIEEEPGRLGAYLELADHCKMQGRLDDAEKVLARGLQANPNDHVLLSAHEEVQVARLDKAIGHWSRQAQANSDDADARAKVERLTAKKNAYEIDVYRRRLTERPDDLGLRLELGLRLARAGQHDAAIAEFQKARSSPALKVQALLHAGLSFEANGVMKLAERNFTDALREVEATDPDNQEMLNELHYRLGRAAEAQGNIKAAEDHYNEVAANDYGYLDVAQRLRSLNQGPST